MRARNRRDEAADAARLKILEAAADVIVDAGVAQLTMTKVGGAAGVSSGLVHYHFDTKELLFTEVLSHSSAVSHSLTEQALDLAGDGRLRVRVDVVDRRRHPHVAAAAEVRTDGGADRVPASAGLACQRGHEGRSMHAVDDVLAPGAEHLRGRHC